MNLLNILFVLVVFEPGESKDNHLDPTDNEITSRRGSLTCLGPEFLI